MWRNNNNCDKNSEISIVVVGESQSGKTQLINKFQNFQFSKVIILIFCVIHFLLPEKKCIQFSKKCPFKFRNNLSFNGSNFFLFDKTLRHLMCSFIESKKDI